MCSPSKINHHNEETCKCPGGRISRFIQPCLLVLLSEKPSYGYELIEGVNRFGFQDGSPDPGAIYRNLRRLEEDGFVISEWETGDAGPAKRYYKLTSDGEDLLHAWASGIRKRKEAFEKFLRKYEEYLRKGENKNV